MWQAQNGIPTVAQVAMQPEEKQAAISLKSNGKEVAVLIPHHPDRIRVVTRLSAVLVRLGELSKAQNLWEQMCLRCCKDFGQSHRATLASYSGLAYVLFESGQTKLAEIACRRSLEA